MLPRDSEASARAEPSGAAANASRSVTGADGGGRLGGYAGEGGGPAGEGGGGHSSRLAQAGLRRHRRHDDRELVLPPQANSFTFDDKGKITQVTVGYVMDRRVGNTGGLGGAFAYFYGTGNPLPIPECQPYTRSLRFRLFSLIGKLAPKK